LAVYVTVVSCIQNCIQHSFAKVKGVMQMELLGTVSVH